MTVTFDPTALCVVVRSYADADAYQARADASRALADAVERLTAERDEARLAAKAEGERADVMQHERDWEQEVVNADLYNRLQAAEADRDRLAAALRDFDAICPKWPRGSTWTAAQEKALQDVRAALAAVAGKAETP